jgi:hypothetical protein
VCDCEAFELQVTTQNVSGYRRAKVSDVAIVPDRWTTVIKLHLTFLKWVKLFNASGESVAKLEHGLRIKKRFPIANCRFQISSKPHVSNVQIGNQQLEIGNIKSVSILSESVPKRVCPLIF